MANGLPYKNDYWYSRKPLEKVKSLDTPCSLPYSHHKQPQATEPLVYVGFRVVRSPNFLRCWIPNNRMHPTSFRGGFAAAGALKTHSALIQGRSLTGTAGWWVEV